MYNDDKETGIACFVISILCVLNIVGLLTGAPLLVISLCIVFGVMSLGLCAAGFALLFRF